MCQIGIAIGCFSMIVLGILFLVGLAKDITWLMWMSGLLLIASFVLVRKSAKTENQKIELVQEEIDRRLSESIHNNESFEATQQFVSVDKLTAIAIDEQRKKVCIVEFDHETLEEVQASTILYHSIEISYIPKIFSYDDILQLEILSDGSSITKTSRKGQIGGAIVGGIIAGGVGAIIAGTGASKTTEEMVKKIQLRIVVNNSQKTYYEVTFQKFDDAKLKDNSDYKEVLHWYNLLAYIIKNDSENDKMNESRNVSNVSDEIMRISELHDKGIITKEEFETLKNAIITKELT